VKRTRGFQNAGEVARTSPAFFRILKREEHPNLRSIPVHDTKPLKPGLLRGLIRDAGLTVEEFKGLL